MYIQNDFLKFTIITSPCVKNKLNDIEQMDRICANRCCIFNIVRNSESRCPITGRSDNRRGEANHVSEGDVRLRGVDSVSHINVDEVCHARVVVIPNLRDQVK